MIVQLAVMQGLGQGWAAYREQEAVSGKGERLPGDGFLVLCNRKQDREDSDERN